jgi:hypothetical protein
MEPKTSSLLVDAKLPKMEVPTAPTLAVETM